MSFLESIPLFAEALIAGVVSAALLGALGTFVIVRRMVFVSAALAQFSTLGLALALWAGGTYHALESGNGASALAAAIAASLAGAALFSLRAPNRRLSRETAIGIGYAAAAALAVLVIDRITAGVHDVTNLMFGNAVAVPPSLLWLVLGVAVAEGLFVWASWRPLVFSAFDAETARAAGYRAGAWNLSLLLAIALAIPVALRALGALPVFGLMVLPAATGLVLARRFAGAVAIAVLVAAVCAFGGFAVSFTLALPTGATMLALGATAVGLATAARALLERRAPNRAALTRSGS